MARYRRPKKPLLLDLVPPVMALIFLGIFFVPGFKEMLGALFVLTLWLVGLAVIGLIAWAIWRHSRKDAAAETEAFMPQPPAPLPKAGDSMATYRAEFGRTTVKETAAPYAVAEEWSRELLSKLEWKRFEEVVAAYSRELGYEAKTTRVGADGGVDVKLFQHGQTSPVMIIQCKAWDAYKVGVKPVRELYGVMAADKVPNGAFFTTGEFTTEAEEWARDKNLDLVNGREFLTRIKSLSPAQQQTLLDLATAGDYTTPTCPSCNVKMILRTASKGRSEGNNFWGCPNYHRGCRQTFKTTQSK